MSRVRVHGAVPGRHNSIKCRWRETPVCRVLGRLALLFPPERSRGALLGSWWRRSGTVPEERGQVAVIVELVRAIPHSDGHDSRDPTKATTAKASRDVDLVRYLQPLIDFQ